MKKPALINLLILALFVNSAAAQAPPSNLRIDRSSDPYVAYGQGDVILIEGDYLWMSAFVSGSFPFSYQWKRNGAPISDATSSYLFLGELTVESSGAYVFTASNSFGSASSVATTVTVVPLPKVVATPVAGGLLGASVQLQVELPDGISVSDMQWTRDGAGESGLLPGATSTVLNLSNLTFADAGNYRFTAIYQNIGGFNRRVSKAFRVKVYQSFTAPVIVTQPVNQSVAPGGSVVFAVGAAGSGPFGYQWRKNGTGITGETNSSLRLANVQAAAAGSYSVVVTPGSGVGGSAAISSDANLTVAGFPAPDSNASLLVDSARASLALGSNSGLASADVTLDAALQTDGDHPTAHFFKASTRLANLVNHSAFKQFFDRLGVAMVGRSIYGWSASAAENADGSLAVPAGMSAQEFTEFTRSNAVPRIRAALSNLEAILDPEFTVDITPAEVGRTSSGNSFANDSVTLDQGDLLLLRAWLSWMEYLLVTMDSWDLNLVLTTLESLSDLNQLTLQNLLAQHPQLFEFRDTSQLAAARAALEKAVDSYVLGMAFVGARPAGLVRLFNLDEDDLDGELVFRRNLLELKGSLNAVLTVNEQPQFRLHYAKLGDGSASLRSLLPAFSGNAPIGGTAADATLGGALTSLGKPAIIIQPTGTRAQVGGMATLGVTAVGASSLTYQWRRNGFVIPGADMATFTIASVSAVDYASYAVTIGNAHGQAASDPVRLAQPGAVVAVWGLDSLQTNLPANVSEVISVSAGYSHALAIRSDGTVVGWGNNNYGQTSPPFGLADVVAVAADSFHSLALRADGTVVGWGADSYGQASPPLGLNNVTAIAAGEYHSLALKGDGTVVAWGYDYYGQSTPPANLDNVVMVAAGYEFSVALKSDGSVVAWGRNDYAQTDVPPGLTGVVAISAGALHTLALQADGRVVAWGGAGFDGQTSVPAGLQGVVSVAAGGRHSFALKADGGIVAWGLTEEYSTLPASSFAAESLVPFRLSGVTGIAAGGSFALAYGPILLSGGPSNLSRNEGDMAVFKVTSIRGGGPFSFQWRFNGADIVGANSPTLTLNNLQSSASGNYSLAVSDGVVTVVSLAAKLAMNALNDGFANARPFPGGGGRLLGSTVTASREAGEPAHAGDPGGGSLWFSWTAAVSGNVNINTIGSNFDTLLAVYTGTELGSLTLIAADDDGAGINRNSLLSFAATAGVSYRIAVDGFGGDSGGVVLNLTPELIIAGFARNALGTFSFATYGPGSSNVVIEASGDLRAWTPVFTNRISEAGVIQFDDPTAAFLLRRYYRATTK